MKFNFFIIYYLLLFLLNSSFSKCQTYSSLISDKEIYCFLNWITKNEEKHFKESYMRRKYINSRIIPWDSANFIDSLPHGLASFDKIYLYESKNGIDTIFNEKDRRFLFEQFISLKESKWHKRFKKSKLIDFHSLKPNHYFFSIPLFSYDRKHAIVRVYYICGLKCGTWGYFVYKKIGDNNWEKINAGQIINSEINK